MNSIKINPTDKVVFDLRMPQVDHNQQKERALRQQIADKYNLPLKNVEINFIPLTLDKKGNKVSLTSDIINNIQKPEFQQLLMKDLIKAENIENVNFDDILAIDAQINSFINFDSYSKSKSYKFKYVKWDNYLSYGKDNYFDFTKLNGLILLNGYPENQCGKTTFAIDLLRFALFGKADKSPTLDSVFNTYLENETEVMVEVCLEIEDTDYVIRRTITRPSLKKRTAKSKSKQKVEYFKLINGSYDLIENCEAESNTQTNNVIRETIGNVEDFNLVISATAFTLGELLRMGQTDKSKLFSRWLGLVSLEEKEKITKEYYKKNVVPKLYSNKYNKSEIENEINDYNTVIASNENEIKNLDKKRVESELLIEKHNNNKLKVLSQKKEIKEHIDYDIISIENILKNMNEELQLKRSIFSSLKDEYFNLKDTTFDKEAYEQKQKKILELQGRNGELKGLVSSNKAEIKRINDLMNEKVCPNCGHSIDVNEQNNFIENIQKKINVLIDEGVKNKNLIDSLQSEVTEMEVNRTNLEKLNNIKLKMSAIKVTIENIKLKIDEYNRKKSEFEVNKENIIFNNDIDVKVRIIDEQIKTETRIKEEQIRNIQKLQSENKNYNEEINKRTKIVSKLIEEEKIIRNWNIYNQLVGKNGIIKIVLRRALPIINNEISRLLNGLCDFDVVLSVSDDNKVCIDLYRDGKKLDLGTCASGFEATISSLALRCALGNISNIPVPNLLVLDEVLSGISADNMENIMVLYKRVLCNYDFILHICHDTTLVDYHDSIITVTKKDNVSVITE